MEELRKYNADIMVVIAFGQILPKEILEMTPYGCVNVHASLLPEISRSRSDPMGSDRWRESIRRDNYADGRRLRIPVICFLRQRSYWMIKRPDKSPR